MTDNQQQPASVTIAASAIVIALACGLVEWWQFREARAQRDIAMAARAQATCRSELETERMNQPASKAGGDKE